MNERRFTLTGSLTAIDAELDYTYYEVAVLICAVPTVVSLASKRADSHTCTEMHLVQCTRQHMIALSSVHVR